MGHLPELVEGVCRGGLSVRLDLAVAEPELTTSISSTLYRVVQEGLTNVVRHSGARSASVEVRREDGAVLARVLDDGSPAHSRVEGGGRGLKGLRARLALFDGTLQFGSTGQGWLLEARIPIDGGRP